MPRDPTSLCRPIQSSDSTTAAGEATISSTPQLLSTWSSVAAALGWEFGSPTSSTSRYDSFCDLPPPAFLLRDGGIANIPMLAERPYRLDLVLTSLLLFFSLSPSLRHDTPLMTFCCSRAHPYDPPVLFRLLVFILSDYITTHLFTTFFGLMNPTCFFSSRVHSKSEAKPAVERG